MAADISIIIPVYNEQDNILPLAAEIATALKNDPRSWELVFVDDASTDSTWGKVGEAHQKDSRIRGIRHLQNGGQSAALWTGIASTDSPVLATLDGDLQNDPADLPRLLREIEKNDFVCGVRVNRQDSLVRRISSKVARHARRMILGVDFRDTGCAFRVFKRTSLTGVFPFNGLHRFLPVIVYSGGATTKEIEISHRARVAGVSKYGIRNRLGRGIVDLLAMAWYQRRRMPQIPVKELETGESDGQPR